MFEEADSCL
jgi:hypothetical protein